MVNAYNKNILRTIKQSIGRYIAIMAIIALGVGFFAGLKSTKPAFCNKADVFFRDTCMYDVRIVSSLGFTADEIEKISEILGDDAYVEGEFYEDAICSAGKEMYVCRFFSINEKVSLVNLTAGRFPERYDECVISYSPSRDVKIGDVIELDNSNPYTTVNRFDCMSYKVVGIVQSPQYIGTDRDSTTLGGGKITTNVYVYDDSVDILFYKALNIKYKKDFKAYSSEYNDFTHDEIVRLKPLVKPILEKRYNSYQESVNDESLSLDLYYLTRNENTGYTSFRNDMDIVENVSKVFPVFFLIIAALVCSTTMARMIDEERETIGVLMAMGYSDVRILMKYLMYSGSAAVIGCIGGFLIGTRLFPYVIDHAYGILYNFGNGIDYYFSPVLFLWCFIVSLLCIVGTTWYTCGREMKTMPAGLLRPKMPRPGKRIFLERIDFIWKRVIFMHKVTLRNVFRFKKRLVMMVFGIAGCQALVLVSFGIKDSVGGISSVQFNDIVTYDFEAIYGKDITLADAEKKYASLDYVDDYVLINRYYYQVEGEGRKKIFLYVCDEEDMKGFYNINMVKGEKRYPKKGEIIISDHLCELLGLSMGDNITFVSGDNSRYTYKVIGTFENYVWHYGFISPDNIETSKYNTVFMNVKKGTDLTKAEKDFIDDPEVISVLGTETTRKRIDDMMSVLNLVVLLVISSAAILSFVVLFNLSNINIIERVREIATVKVLGFYDRETRDYVFRENAVFTFLGIVIGIPMGIVLLKFVMMQIQVDMVAFTFRLKPLSYVYSIVITIAFTWFTNLVMSRKVDNIDMTTSLKSAE